MVALKRGGKAVGRGAPAARGHAGLASSRRRGVTIPAAQSRGEQAREKGRWGPLTGGLRGGERKGKTLVQLQKSKSRSFRALKLINCFLELAKNTTDTTQQETLENLLWIGRSKKKKLAVFEFSDNFVAQFNG
jgi:hypothetical protein